MCGFAALVEPGRLFEEPLLRAMEVDLAHRGPDGGTVAAEPGIGLVFRRLAILDPTRVADQPMSDEDGACTLVFNGEIYNYRFLRGALEREGVRFRSTGDTEVLLRGYLAWGEEILDRLEGMFAFALVDRRRRVVLAARDPFGIKPLYLLRHGRLVGLASEMRPFARLRPPVPDPAALAELLTFRFAAGGLSNLRDVERVPGGTLLRVGMDDGVVTRRRYCDPLDTLQALPMPASDAADAVEQALVASVEAHLISDVGYAVQLSGGVDSSLVAALAAARTGEPLGSFGIALGGGPFDEAPYRRALLDVVALDHHEVQFDGRAYADALPRAVRHLEGPTPHGGCVLLMLLCDHVARHRKVVLTGEGADEFFGGYERYARWRQLAWQERLARLAPASFWRRVPRTRGVQRFVGRDAAAWAAVYTDPEPMHRLFPALVPVAGAREAVSARFEEFRDRLLAVDQSAYLESLLVRQDKMAMAASVEARVPFTHLPLARVANRVPRALRVPGRETKPLLKQLAERHVPASLVHRRKVGLVLPYDEWLADEKGLGRYLEDLTAQDGRLSRFGDAAALREAVARFRAGQRDGLPSMLTLVQVEIWLRQLDAA